MSLFTLEDDRGPGASLEIAGHRVSGVRVEMRGANPAVVAHAVEPLPDGALMPSLAAANVHNRAAVMRALTRVLEQLGRPRRVGLVIPDLAARLSMVKFAQVPARLGELDQLIRWQVKKSLPFAIEEAQLSYSRAATLADGQEFLVTAARRDIVQEYEGLCAEAGAHAGLVDVSTPNVINAVLATSAVDRDCLVVNLAREWVSLAVIRSGAVALLRGRAVEGHDTLADLVHQTAMYYEDRLNGTGFAHVLLCGSTVGDAADADGIRRNLEERLSTNVTPVDPMSSAPLADRNAVPVSLMDALAASVGLLLRYREAAA